MNISEVTAELRKIAGSVKTLDQGVSAAMQLLAEPRYIERGSGQLVTDIRAAIKRLPQEAQSHGKALLTPTNSHTNWTFRINSIAVGNGGARAKYGELILAFVAHELLEVWRHDDRPADRPIEQLERVSYELMLEVDDDDHRKHTITRKIISRAAVPKVRPVFLSHYYIAGTVDAEVEMLSPGQKYLTTIPDQLGSDNKWHSHVIDLGRYYEVGEPVCIETHETYCDEAKRLHTLFPVFGLHELIQVYSSAMEFIEVSIRLPRDLVEGAVAKAQVGKPPLFHEAETFHPPISKDGWVSQRFEKLDVGNQYVLFFPGLKLYA